MFRCPSDGEALRPSNYVQTLNGAPVRSSRSSYRYSLGDGIWNVWEDWNSSAVNNPRTYTRGMFTARHHKDFGFISDGSSNTIGFSERCVAIVGTEAPDTSIGTELDNRVRSGVGNGNDLALHAGGVINPANCLNNAPLANDRNTLRTPHPSWGGGIFGDGRPANDAFQTVLPPNRPSCGWSLSGGGDGWVLVSASSYHSGGANAVFMDGAVRFIPDTIDAGNPSGPQGGTHEGTGVQPVASGSSSYGVWGALGTPQGNETQSL